MPSSKNSNPPNVEVTHWFVVWIAFGAGITAATHIGKLPPALTEIRTELGAGLILGGWIASAISATGFVLGLVAGAIADRLGERRVLVFGLLMLACGSLMGALADSAMLLLVSRFIEGIGFTAATVTGASMIAQATVLSDRKWAMGVWAAYMPIGFATMMVFTALVIETVGWRNLWLFSSVISVIWAAIVFWGTATWQRNRTKGKVANPIFQNLVKSLSQVGCLLVAICFALYAAQHISMMSWLPTYMSEVYGSSALVAAGVPALVLLFNAGGSNLGARAMKRGVPIWLLLSLGCGGMALTEIAIFTSGMPDGARMVFALLFGIAGGLIPAAALASASVYARSAAMVGAMSGIIVMGTNAGQLFGPPLLAAAREYAGSWNGILWLLVSLAGAALVLALISRITERKTVNY